MSKQTIHKNDKAINQILLPYVGCLVILVALAQAVIVWRGTIDWFAGIALVPAFIYYVLFAVIKRRSLKTTRFGNLVTHMATYLIVNLGYHIHAIFALNSGSLDEAKWSGFLIIMPVVWGISLLIHMIASISQKGYEELEV